MQRKKLCGSNNSCQSSETESEAIVLKEDNQSAIAMTKNPQCHGRSKHIAIKHHFVREQVSAGAIELEYCRTEDMIADILTKCSTFEKLREMAGIVPLPIHLSNK